MLWIKEVEMIASVDDLKMSWSIGGYRFLKLKMPDAEIASALKKIMMKLYFKKKVSLKEQKAQMEDLFFRARQIAHMIYEYFWVIGVHEVVLDYSDLFWITLNGDDIQDSDVRSDEVL